MRIVLDLYGTLVRKPQAAYAAHLASIAERHLGTDPACFIEAFARTSAVREHASWTFVPALMRAAQDCGTRAGIAAAQATYHACVHAAREHLEQALHPAALGTISQLRAHGHSPWGCGNASGDTAAALAGSHLAQALDGIVVSADIGLANPHPGSYWAADPAGGGAYASGQLLHLQGARSAGQHAIQVPLLHEDGSLTFEAGWDGLRIADISHLPALVQAIAWPASSAMP